MTRAFASSDRTSSSQYWIRWRPKESSRSRPTGTLRRRRSRLRARRTTSAACKGGQRPLVHAAEQRDLRVVDDAPEHRVSPHQRRRRAGLVHAPLLTGEEIAQGQALPGVDRFHLPDREPGGALGFEPLPLVLGQAPGWGPKKRLKRGLATHAVVIHRPGGGELRRFGHVVEVLCVSRPLGPELRDSRSSAARPPARNRACGGNGPALRRRVPIRVRRPQYPSHSPGSGGRRGR